MTVYEGCDEEEARIAYRKVVHILHEVPGCRGERVQLYRRPFKAELVCEDFESGGGTARPPGMERER